VGHVSSKLFFVNPCVLKTTLFKTSHSHFSRKKSHSIYQPLRMCLFQCIMWDKVGWDVVIPYFNLFGASIRSRNILFREGMMLSSIFLRMSSSSHCSLTTSHSQPYPHQESACGKGVPERSDDACCVKATGHAAKKGKGGSGLRVASRQQHNGGSSRTAGSSARAAAHVQQAVGSITRASVQQL
jgi:hypothetical protein